MFYGFYLFIFCVTVLLAVVLTMAMRKLAFRYDFLDMPEGRKMHAAAKPLLGGLGIFVAFNFVLLSVLLLFHFGFFKSYEICRYISDTLSGNRIFAVLSGGFMVMLLGLYDDRKCVGPHIKLLAQFLIAAYVFFMGIKITLFVDSIFVSYLFTSFWVVFIMNAFNLLDNIDGLSAGIAVIACIFSVCISLFFGQYVEALMFLILAGAVLGFLFFNFSPSSIFMGDCGSLFIGYMISVLTIETTYLVSSDKLYVSFMTPVLLLAIPLYDTFSVLIIRMKNRVSIFAGDNNHFSHRLLRLGMSVKGAVLFLYLISCAVSICAVLIPYVSFLAALLLFIQSLIILFIVAMLEYYGSKINNTK